MRKYMSNLSTQEKVRLINKLIQKYHAINKASDKLESAIGQFNENSPIFVALWDNFDFTVDLVSDLVDDNNEWIPWFIWDNDLGKNLLTAKIGQFQRKIKNVNELVKIIELDNIDAKNG